MKLREEYKNIDIEKVLMDNLEKGDFAKVEGKVTSRNLERMNKSLELIKENNWEEIYVALYFMLDKMHKINKKLKVKSIEDGVIGKVRDISIIVFTSLAIKNDGKFKELSAGVIVGEYNKDNVIIEVPQNEKEDVIKILDTICTEWQDTFIIVEEQEKKNLIKIALQ